MSGTVVFEGSGKVRYDNVVDSGGACAPTGSFIEMATKPGSSFTVIFQLQEKEASDYFTRASLHNYF